jgi:hypothetical protein
MIISSIKLLPAITQKKLNLTETYAVSSGKDGIIWLENFIMGAEDKLFY